MPHLIDAWLSAFNLDASLHPHVAVVLAALPGEVRDDFMSDPCFTLADYEPGRMIRVAVGTPRLSKEGGGASRAVVLKRRMWRSDTGFIRWVIAHELAHAHLRNEGRYPGEDPEAAADALAAMWGFPRPW